MKISRKNLYQITTATALTVAVVAGVIFYLYKNDSLDFGFLNSEISAYVIRCEKTNTNGSCADEVALPEITFKVYRQQQYVVSINSTGGVTKISPCTIVNLKNWECDLSDNSDTLSLSFVDGNFSMSAPTSSALGNVLSTITVVSKKEWLRYPVSDGSPLSSESLQPQAPLNNPSADNSTDLSNLPPPPPGVKGVTLTSLVTHNQWCQNTYGADTIWDGVTVAENSSSCICKSGYDFENNSCVPATNEQICQYWYGSNSEWGGTMNGNRPACTCVSGYQMTQTTTPTSGTGDNYTDYACAKMSGTN